MNIEQYFKNLSVPSGKIDVVLDTDAFNEVDDQFAIAYMLKSKEKLNVEAIYAAPFFNENSVSPEDGMVKSYDEIMRILSLMKQEDMKKSVFHGSADYLSDEQTPVISDAANDIVKRAKNHSPENPLYVVGIGVLTDIASAVLLAPEIVENIVIVWLGGSDIHFGSNLEFNAKQDVAAARVVFGCGAPFVQLPCQGVVSSFTVSAPELETWLSGKNELCDFLVGRVFESQKNASCKTWTRVIWDVTAIAWLLNDNDRFMYSDIIKAPIPEYDNTYSLSTHKHFINYVKFINRDALFEDLFDKLTQ